MNYWYEFTVENGEVTRGWRFKAHTTKYPCGSIDISSWANPPRQWVAARDELDAYMLVKRWLAAGALRQEHGGVLYPKDWDKEGAQAR